MGNTTSNNLIELPLGKNYSISYCRFYDITSEDTFQSSINLERLLPNRRLNTTELIWSLFFYKVNLLGYHFLKFNLLKFDKLPLNVYLPKIKISDLTIKSKCFNPNFKNVAFHLNNNCILIAGIIMDQEFIEYVLKCDYLTTSDITSDIVLIVGYTPSTLLIKTSWVADVLEIPLSYLGNIKEIWNISIESPEEKYSIEN